jgi:1-pyrroline-5-carboxylate dehydrogenase
MRWWAGWATPTAPALLGNTVVWKPSPTQELAAHLTMGLLAEACLPPGVINLVTGDDRAVSEVALADPELAGIHFTGSTATFKLLWRTVADHLDGYRGYPRLVGDTGGKDFALAHPCADPAAQDRARPGSVEYQPSSRVLSNTSGTEGVVGHRFSRTNR